MKNAHQSMLQDRVLWFYYCKHPELMIQSDNVYLLVTPPGNSVHYLIHKTVGQGSRNVTKPTYCSSKPASDPVFTGDKSSQKSQDCSCLVSEYIHMHSPIQFIIPTHHDKIFSTILSIGSVGR